MPRKSWRVGLVGMLASGLAIYLILSSVDLMLLGDALARARYGYVLPTALLLTVGLLTRAARWRALLDSGLALDRAFHILNISYLVNGVLPLRIGEVARAFLAARVDPPVPLLRSASTILIERLLDLLAVLFLLGFALAAAPTLPDAYRSAGLVALAALVIGFAGLLLLAWRRSLAERALLLLPTGLRGRVAPYLTHFLDGLMPLTRRDLLGRALFWTAASWGFSVAGGYILMLAFFDRADLAATCLYIAAAAFVIAVPAVPGNIGTYQWAIMLALSALGYGQPTDAINVSFAVVVHAVNLGLYALMGVIGFVHEGVSLDYLRTGVERINQQPVTDQ